jgi:purine-nucleoside/S-methyl-5'-thioadenosine phosphorylase / adenosine deaminase
VGEEVHAAFVGAHRERRNLDLKAIARERLHGAGVGEVRDLEICTICDERFFSHRREGARAGRQAGVAWRG